MEVTDAIRSRIEKRVESLRKLVEGVEPARVDIEVGKPSDHHKKGDVYYAEFNADINGNMMRAEATGEDLYNVIDDVQKELRRQIAYWRKSQKKKMIDQGRAFKQQLRSE